LNPAESHSPLDKDQFEVLFRTHFTSLRAFALKLIRDDDAAKDIVHMVFLNLWEKRDTLTDQDTIKSYLFRSVHNRSLNYIRDQKKFSDPTYEQWDTASGYVQSTDFMEARELEDKINETLDSLPDKCRQVFILSRFEGKKYSEIATDLGISVKTVEAQMSKALKILREQLSDYMYMVLLFLFFDKFM